MGLRTGPQPFLLSARTTRVRAMAQNTRARSENGEDKVGHAIEGPAPGQPEGQTEMFLKLIQELRRDRQDRQMPQLPVQPGPQPNQVFKPPEYNGVRSIEIIIRQFMDVAEANHWDERTMMPLQTPLSSHGTCSAGSQHKAECTCAACFHAACPGSSCLYT